MRKESASRPAPRRRAIAAGLAAAVALGTLLIAPISSVVTAQPASAAAKLCTSTPFRSSPSHHYWYRIPAVVKSPTTKVTYAFAERRDNTTRDTGNFDIAMVSSRDNGCSWTSPKTIFSHGNDKVASPTPIVSATGRVFLLVSARYTVGGVTGGHMYVMSTADGFTSHREITFPFSAGLPGPSHGIVLRHGPHAGRMVFPISYVDHNGRYGIALGYSDDNGVTWTSGREQPAPAGVQTIEASVVERYDGNIMVSARDSALRHGEYLPAGDARWYTLSTDSGATMQTFRRGHAPRIVSVQASMIAPVSGRYSHDIFMVAPAQITPGEGQVRRDESVFVSGTRGATWHAAHNLERSNTPAAYSDVTQIDASTLGIVYEGGSRSYKEQIKFVAIRMSSAI